MTTQGKDWQVLVLAGPVGSGKASVGQRLGAALPGSVYMQVYRSKTSQLSLTGDVAREAGIREAREHLAGGRRVVIDDVIETPGELALFIDAFPDARTMAVTLMPSFEEMERRDALKPIDQRAGSRLAEVYQAMSARLAQASTVLDTSGETVEDTTSRVLALVT